MDKDKKKELAEMDSRWDFEKTIRVPEDYSWEDVRERFNELQEKQGDLYMQVSKLPEPSLKEKIGMKFKAWKTSSGEKLTFHHRQIFEWYQGLANHLNVTIGEAITKTFDDIQGIRESLELGEQVNVQINDLDDMSTAEGSKVSKDELQEMIDDE